jgi:biopolymer transport protein ExbB
MAILRQMGHPLPGNMLGNGLKEVNCTSIIRIIINGCCVLIWALCLISKACRSGNLDQFMTSVQKDIKAGNIEGLCFMFKQKVLLQIQLNQLYWNTKVKEGLDSEAAAETIHKKLKKLLH